MPDFNLAQLYGVETRFFKQPVKRTVISFPKDIMFKLFGKEQKEILSSQVVMIDAISSSSQIVMNSIKYRSAKYLPYAFTQHGVTMLASILKSTKA